MFEKFTEKAIEAVKQAQICAIELNHEKIYPEHLLLALLNDPNNIIVKTFSVYKIEINQIKQEIENLLNKRAVIKLNYFIVILVRSILALIIKLNT